MSLSTNLSNQLKESSIEPIIVLQLDGISTLYGSDTIKKIPRYGDDNLFYDNPKFVYGGLVPIDDQLTLISLDGTTTTIKQNLSPDKARGSGITSLTINLVDINNKATELASGTHGEILYRNCKVWAGFGENGSFIEDYILIFRGVVESVDIGQGSVKFMLSSPDQKKRSLLLPKGDTKCDGAVNDSQTTIALDSVENFIVVPSHPAYAPKDTSLLTYAKIGNEIIQYDNVSGNSLTGCIRGSLGTVAVAHNDESQVETFFRITGNAMDLALKLMLSDGLQSPYISALSASAVNLFLSGTFPNSIYFGGIDLTRSKQVRVGDFVRTAGFTQGGNNFAGWVEVLDVVVADQGSYIVVNQALTNEATATGTVDFLSRYNSLGDFGLNINTEEVDIEKHEFLRRSFLANFNYQFNVKDEIDEGKEWIESELYRPAGCYSLPADKGGLARVSVGLHIAPLPNQSIVTISNKNITNPTQLAVKRSINKNYYNSVLIKYEDSPVSDEFTRKVFALSGTTTVPTGNKTLDFESLGLKDSLQGAAQATLSSSRLLGRYRSAAEFINGVNITFALGVQINVGDIVILDPVGLNLVNQDDQSRNRPQGLWEVVNKSIDIKGKASVDLINTSFNINARYGLWSATSRLKTILSTTKFFIESAVPFSQFGTAEYRKWENYPFAGVRIRNADYSLTHETFISLLQFNTVTIDTPPPFALAPGMVMEIATYDFAAVTEAQKLVYCFWSDGTNDFGDGGNKYVFV